MMASLVVTCPHCGLKTLTTHDECLHCEKTLGPLVADISTPAAAQPAEKKSWPLETPLPTTGTPAPPMETPAPLVTPEPLEPEMAELPSVEEEFIANLPPDPPMENDTDPEPVAPSARNPEDAPRRRLSPARDRQKPSDTVWPPKPRGFTAPKRILRRVNPNRAPSDDLPDLRPSQRGKCPAGHGPLRQGHIGESTVQHCSSCDSMWLTHPVFREFVVMQAKQVLADGTIPPLSRHDLTQPPDDRPAMRCPVCTEPMRRKPHEDIPGIPLDVCDRHGVWLRDRDLQAVMRFIATAGRDYAHKLLSKSE